MRTEVAARIAKAIIHLVILCVCMVHHLVLSGSSSFDGPGERFSFSSSSRWPHIDVYRGCAHTYAFTCAFNPSAIDWALRCRSNGATARTRRIADLQQHAAGDQVHHRTSARPHTPTEPSERRPRAWFSMREMRRKDRRMHRLHLDRVCRSRMGVTVRQCIIWTASMMMMMIGVIAVSVRAVRCRREMNSKTIIWVYFYIAKRFAKQEYSFCKRSD